MSNITKLKRPVVADGAPGLHLQELHREKLRALAWHFRQTRSCHWGGVDRASPILEYTESLLASGIDRREVLTEFLCCLRCCGDCKS